MTIRIIEPYIKTFEDAEMQIRDYGKPAMFFFADVIDALVLVGGSIKHPVAISLIKAMNTNNMFGHYKHVENIRMVIKDGLYRTKYCIDEDDFIGLKASMLNTAIERKITITLRSKNHLPGYIVGKGIEWGLFDGRFNLRIPMMADNKAYVQIEKPKVEQPLVVEVQP